MTAPMTPPTRQYGSAAQRKLLADLTVELGVQPPLVGSYDELVSAIEHLMLAKLTPIARDLASRTGRALPQLTSTTVAYQAIDRMQALIGGTARRKGRYTTQRVTANPVRRSLRQVTAYQDDFNQRIRDAEHGYATAGHDTAVVYDNTRQALQPVRTSIASQANSRQLDELDALRELAGEDRTPPQTAADAQAAIHQLRKRFPAPHPKRVRFLKKLCVERGVKFTQPLTALEVSQRIDAILANR